MQRDAKMVSYKVVDKSAKPYVEVDVAGEKKVRSQPSDAPQFSAARPLHSPSLRLLIRTLVHILRVLHPHQLGN